MVHCPYFLLRLQGRNRVGRVGKPSALQMMPIEMEIGRREGVTFAINSLGNTANKKSAEKSLFVDFLRFILIAPFLTAF